MFSKINWFYVSCVLGIVLVMFAGNQVVLYSKEEAKIVDLTTKLQNIELELKDTQDRFERMKFEKDVLISQKDVELKSLKDEIDKIKHTKQGLREEITSLKTQVQIKEHENTHAEDGAVAQNKGN